MNHLWTFSFKELLDHAKYALILTALLKLLKLLAIALAAL